MNVRSADDSKGLSQDIFGPIYPFVESIFHSVRPN